MKVFLFITVFIISMKLSAQWIQVGGDIIGPSDQSNFGLALSMSSDGSTIGINGSGLDGRGLVQIYRRNGNGWIQIGNDITGESEFDFLGRSISLSSDGKRIAIGIPKGSTAIFGEVKVFEFISNDWVQLGESIQGLNSQDDFGSSVSISGDGNSVAISSPQTSNPTYVQVYQFNNGSWNQLGNSIFELPIHRHGSSLSLSSNGMQVAIGAPGDGNQLPGHVKIFEWDEADWIQIGENIEGEAAGDWFGYSVSISGDGQRVVIGAPRNSGASYWAGHARVFEWNQNNWVQIGKDIDGIDNLGYSASISKDGNTIAIGGVFNSDFSGYTKLFSWTGSEWSQIGEDINGSSPFDRSGSSISVNGDGSQVAIGSPTGRDGVGFVEIFEFPEPIIELKSDDVEALTVYPNPTSSQFEIIDSNNVINEISLSTLDGKLLSAIDYLGEGKYDISKLDDGYYLVIFKLRNNKVLFKKIVKSTR